MSKKVEVRISSIESNVSRTLNPEGRHRLRLVGLIPYVWNVKGAHFGRIDLLQTWSDVQRPTLHLKASSLNEVPVRLHVVAFTEGTPKELEDYYFEYSVRDGVFYPISKKAYQYDPKKKVVDPKQGDLLSPKTKVKTQRGTAKLKDLKVGDTVPTIAEPKRRIEGVGKLISDKLKPSTTVAKTETQNSRIGSPAVSGKLVQTLPKEEKGNVVKDFIERNLKDRQIAKAAAKKTAAKVKGAVEKAVPRETLGSLLKKEPSKNPKTKKK